MNDATVRPATPEDAAAVHDVAVAAWHDAHAPLVGESAVADFLGEYYAEADLRDAIRGEEGVFLVAERAGDVVGFLETGPTDDPGTWSVYRVYVHPDEYGRGFGTRLLDAAERRLDGRDVRRLRLVVMADNERAVGFYEARGFERVETRENQWGNEDYAYAKPLDDTA